MAEPTQAVEEAMERIRQQGPCGMCGGPYARHRIIDAYAGMLKAGESLEAIAEWYGADVEQILPEIEALRKLKRAKRRAGS